MVQNAVNDPIVVELELTPTKVLELVLRGFESSKLDYKVEINYTTARSRLTLVKHVLALANSAGGYIVVGVRDDGTLEGVNPKTARQLDETTVRGWVAGFTAVPISIAVHNSVTHDGKQYVVIGVLPLLSQIAVATGDGQYTDKTKNQFAFRKGDVLVRHGTSSERWTQADADYIIGRIALAQKEQWIRDFAPDFRSMITQILSATGSSSAKEAIDATAFHLGPDAFQKLLFDLLRKT